jgi:hypothetical protein
MGSFNKRHLGTKFDIVINRFETFDPDYYFLDVRLRLISVFVFCKSPWFK